MLLALGISLRNKLGGTNGVAIQANVPAGVTPGTTNTSAGTATNVSSVSGQDASDESDDEYATSFVTLPFADDPDALENGAVVRVVMTRSELASLGMPAVEGSSDEIPADLVVSDDGTPQAIRLVSQAEID